MTIDLTRGSVVREILEILVLVCKRATDEDVRPSLGFGIVLALSALTRFCESSLFDAGLLRLLDAIAVAAVEVVFALAERMRAMAPAAEPVCSSSAARVSSFLDAASQKNSQVRESRDRPNEEEDPKLEEVDGSIADWLRWSVPVIRA